MVGACRFDPDSRQRRDRANTGLTGMFRDLIVTRVFCAERFLFAARLDWLHRYWQRAACPAPAKRVQIFNDRAGLFVGIPQTSQFAL
jgi:hypothetical protein